MGTPKLHLRVAAKVPWWREVFSIILIKLHLMNMAGMILAAGSRGKVTHDHWRLGPFHFYPTRDFVVVPCSGCDDLKTLFYRYS